MSNSSDGGDELTRPTPKEREAAERLLQKMQSRPPPPKFTVDRKGGTTQISSDHHEPALNAALLADALGVPTLQVGDILLNQIANIARSGKDLTAAELNGMLAVIQGLGPRDTAEALLAVQMAAIHEAVTVAARRLKHVENIPQQDSASNMLNKLARTYASQIEALKRYRSSGEQKVTVQHVNVTAGQAVIGINQGGGGAHEKSSQSHALGKTADSGCTDACGPTLLSHEQAVQLPLQGTSSEGRERVSNARCKGGSADG